MKFTVEKNTLFKSLSHVQSIVEKKNTLPILSNILLEARENLLVLSATDMDISITDKLNCNIIEEGSTTISARTLYDIIRKLPESSEIEIISNKGKIMSLRAGKSKFSLGRSSEKIFFKAIEVKHGKTNSLGYIFENTAYISDTNDLSIVNMKELRNIKYLIIDCLKFIKHPSHFNLSESLYVHQKLKPKKTILTNLHYDLDYNYLLKKLPRNVVPAYDGLKIGL